ncbi:MAG: acyltransferase family protein [Saprospiraceae bacterium]|nr:acyltransferase family protein [Saprospiraceae bacterium]
MNTLSQKTERLHALDSLRAIMMMLGIVLHSVLTYIGGEPYAAWRIRDPNNFNTGLEWISSIIHVFRMPIFMIVAGFFASLLFYERGAQWMLKNRMSRITYPFLVFVVILFVPVVGGMNFTDNVFNSNPNALSDALSPFKTWIGIIPDRTMHLWFLYYLIMFSLASFALGLIFKKLPKLSGLIHSSFHTIFNNILLRLVVFTLLTVGMLLLMNRNWADTSTSLVPDLNTFYLLLLFLHVWLGLV